MHSITADVSVRNAGQIGYALCPMVARGAMLGPDQPVILHLLDIEPAKQALEGVKMELLDAAFPLLQGAPLVLQITLRPYSQPQVVSVDALLRPHLLCGATRTSAAS